MIIITSGNNYTDIDALAGCFAYKELLEIKGIKSKVILSSKYTLSITDEIQNWKLHIADNLVKGDYKYILIDISDINNIHKIADPKKIIEIYDHHTGFENYWKHKLGNKAVIEKVGAASTLIFEKIFKERALNKISKTIVNLLYTAIISNTLNLKAQITTQRDIQAIQILKNKTTLPIDWITVYYNEIDKKINANPLKFILEDTKTIAFNGKNISISQIEMWNSQEFVINNEEKILEFINSYENKNIFLTAPSIKEGRNYIYCVDIEIRNLLSKIIDVQFNTNLGLTDKLWLRKEIIEKIYNIS